ncbi:MAG: thiamine pyrophosphate-binding protein [Treponemataceae bacterium]
MKKKAAEYIAELLVEKGISQVFSVVGGGAMHLNDAFNNTKGLHCVFNHHEQACAIAAESYARFDNRPACVCVTTGPGGTNALTGVLCAWQDSIPMLVISGQVRYETTVTSTGLNLRQFGEQEHYIVDTVSSITKYAKMLSEPKKIRYEIEKAIYLANSGRRGPTWIDIPLNIQGMIIETDEQEKFVPEASVPNADYINDVFEKINVAIQTSNRPVIIAGAGLRTSGVYKSFLQFIKKMKTPVLSANGNPDLLSDEEPYYYGNFGSIGGRAGNFIVQNSDCLLVLGARLSFKQIGFNYKLFSPRSFKIVVDIDKNELRKNTVHIDLPVNLDLKLFFDNIDKLQLKNISCEWYKYCNEVKNNFSLDKENFVSTTVVNPYVFSFKLKHKISKNAIIVVGNSCGSDMMRQVGIKYNTQRLWGNTNCGTMGYDLPAAIGVAIASRSDVICITGDGSIEMNLQELQTIIHNNLPIKIFIHNNNSYGAIIQTQSNFFGRLSGCTNNTGISFPDFEKLSYAYGFPYWKCSSNSDLDIVIDDFLNADGFGICEIISDVKQPIIPRTKTKVLENGEMKSTAIDDLFPFLDDAIYKKYSTYFNDEVNNESD